MKRVALGTDLGIFSSHKLSGSQGCQMSRRMERTWSQLKDRGAASYFEGGACRFSPHRSAPPTLPKRPGLVKPDQGKQTPRLDRQKVSCQMRWYHLEAALTSWRAGPMSSVRVVSRSALAVRWMTRGHTTRLVTGGGRTRATGRLSTRDRTFSSNVVGDDT